ncbi:MAG: sensor histidine kinase [Phycisphaerales bacterium]
MLPPVMEFATIQAEVAPPRGGGLPWFVLMAGAISLLVGAVIAWRQPRRRRSLERHLEHLRGRIAEVSSMTGGLAHEIKNPLSTLVLNTQMLDEEIDDAVPDVETRGRLHRRLGSLVRETVRLRGILEDFLRYAGRLRLDPQPLDIAALVADLVDFFHPQCDQASVLLRAEIPAGPLEAEVDEGHLKQAVLNLMLNALQAMDSDGASSGTPRHELIVRVEADQGEIRIHVIDTGPGIPADRIEEVFRPYVSGKPGGSGLGLPTARRIVEEHGGTLSVHSEPGRGSDFVVRLARRGGPSGDPRPNAAATTPSAR